VITVLLFLFTKNGKGNWIGFVISGLSIGFLVMTHSKSSLGFLPLALTAALAYRLGSRDGLSRAILCVITTILLLGLALFAVFDASTIAHVLEDPTEFTGRAAIWQAELAYIHDHPFLGAGFGTFADNGGLSPLHNYVSGSWVEAVSHGHNGYLQLLVTIGSVGLVLGMIGLVISPLARFWPLNTSGTLFKPLLFGLFIFLILHNVMESDFLEGDGVAWTALLMVIAALRNSKLSESLTNAA
jgi:exopolysaccharide production protein ExoQ